MGLSWSHRIAGFVLVGWFCLNRPSCEGAILKLEHVVQYASLFKCFVSTCCANLLEVTNPWMNSLLPGEHPWTTQFLSTSHQWYSGLQLLSQRLVSISSLRLIGTCKFSVDDEQFVLEFLTRKFSWSMVMALTGKIQITSGSFTFHVSMSWLKFKKMTRFLKQYKR